MGSLIKGDSKNVKCTEYGVEKKRQRVGRRNEGQSKIK